MDSKLNSGFNPNYLSHPWFKTKWFKITLTAVAVVAVILVVLFNQQIGNLLRFFGSKAALETGNITLDGTNATASNYFLFNGTNGYTADTWDPATGNWVTNKNAVKVEDNKLMINP